MDPTRQVAELDYRTLELAVRVADVAASRIRVALELLQRHAEAHPEGEQPLLRSVVEIALDLPAVGDSDVHRAGLRLAKRVDLPLELVLPARAEQGARNRAVEACEPADDPRHEREQE